ncbi:MAG: DciA family protein [Parvularculaceae bacterium]
MRPFRTKPPRSAAPPVSRAASGVFAELARQTKFIDPALAEQWPSLAGERAAALCRPGKITGRPPGRTLEVHAASSAAAAEIALLADGLIARLNGYFGPGFITRLSVRQSAPPPAPAGAGDGLGAALSSFRAAVRRRTPENPEDN